MTAVVGFCESGKVWMGADSAGVAGWDLTVRADTKLFKNGAFLFGFTTSYRMGQLLRYSFVPPGQMESQDTSQFMCTSFVDAVRACLKAGGYAEKDKERESAGEFLVGYRGRLFLICGDYQVAEAADGYEACGCGAQIARGALFATKDRQPLERLHMVLAASERHCAGVRGPFITDVI